jgi:hypothetical protein
MITGCRTRSGRGEGDLRGDGGLLGEFFWRNGEFDLKRCYYCSSSGAGRLTA